MGQGEGPLEESQRPTALGQQTTPNKPNSLQKCLQQLGDIGRVMEDNYWPEQKLGDVQLQETGGSAGCVPVPLTCSPSQSTPVYLSDHTMV